MHIHTSICTYIFITACGHLKHERVMSGIVKIKINFPNNEIWTRFNNLKWTYVKYPNGKCY